VLSRRTNLGRGVGGTPLQKRTGRQFFSRVGWGAPIVCMKEGGWPLPIIERGGSGRVECWWNPISDSSPLQGPSRGTAGQITSISFWLLARRGVPRWGRRGKSQQSHKGD